VNQSECVDCVCLKTYHDNADGSRDGASGNSVLQCCIYAVELLQ